MKQGKLPSQARNGVLWWQGLTAPSVELEAPSELEMAGRMTMRFDGGEYKLPVLPAEEFPVPPEEVTMREPIQGQRS
jgi:hypothetical protein